jgi:hypothetical protein
LTRQLEDVYGEAETWDATHRAIYEDCKVYASRMNAYEKKRKAEKKAEGTFTKKAKVANTATASTTATPTDDTDTIGMPDTPPAEEAVATESAEGNVAK